MPVVKTNMKELTQQRNLMRVSTVETPSTTPIVVADITGATLQKNLMHEHCGKAVNNPSRCNKHKRSHTTGSRRLIHASIVGKPLFGMVI